jgi:hypothetical protein
MSTINRVSERDVTRAATQVVASETRKRVASEFDVPAGLRVPAVRDTTRNRYLEARIAAAGAKADAKRKARARRLAPITVKTELEPEIAAYFAAQGYDDKF